MAGLQWTNSNPGPLVTSYDIPGIKWTNSNPVHEVQWTYSIPGPTEELTLPMCLVPLQKKIASYTPTQDLRYAFRPLLRDQHIFRVTSRIQLTSFLYDPHSFKNFFMKPMWYVLTSAFQSLGLKVGNVSGKLAINVSARDLLLTSHAAWAHLKKDQN